MKRRPMSPGDYRLVRTVGRLPARVHTKLLIAFVGTAVLLVAVGALGLRVLAQSDDRVSELGPLQERAAAYGKLQSDTSNVRNLLAENLGRNSDYFVVWPDDSALGVRVAVDQAIANQVRRIPATTFPDRLGFVPPAEDESVLREIREESDRLSVLMEEVIRDPNEAVRAEAERLAEGLDQLASELANATTAKANVVIADNARAYESSRSLYVGVAVGAIGLALVLGFVLSWSVVGPIQRIDSRLATIAAGDFSGHVDVENRDELGALAANVNRTNDELKRLYAELEAASQHKSDFLANMSHELRTPLNAIIGFSQVLSEGMAGAVNEKQAEYLDDILSSANHLLALINDVLDLSKVEAGQVELEKAPFSLREALERGVVVVRERASDDGVSVALDADPDADVVEGDERRIQQVIFNLLSNAVKFTPVGGAVDVTS
ncbi:MAG TPA: histidine kinase dimerization/phospho-acceptor domain-containing protein, partial [Actinomycetota bacterium]